MLLRGLAHLVCPVTAFFNQFLDVRKVLLHQRAQLSQDLSQFIGVPRGCGSFAQFSRSIFSVHESRLGQGRQLAN